MQHQKIVITGNHKIRCSVDGELEKLVVLGIAAGTDNVNDRLHFGDASEPPEVLLALFYGDVWVELGPGQDIGKFLERCFGDQELRLFDCFPHCLARYGGRQ